MDWRLILEFLVIVGALAMGARMGGVGLGLWGAVGLLVLVVVFDVAPANIPGGVLLIVLTVIMAASAMEVAGAFNMSHLGWNHLCGRALRWDPRAPAPIMPYMHQCSGR